MWREKSLIQFLLLGRVLVNFISWENVKLCPYEEEMSDLLLYNSSTCNL